MLSSCTPRQLLYCSPNVVRVAPVPQRILESSIVQASTDVILNHGQSWCYAATWVSIAYIATWWVSIAPAPASPLAFLQDYAEEADGLQHLLVCGGSSAFPFGRVLHKTCFGVDHIYTIKYLFIFHGQAFQYLCPCSNFEHVFGILLEPCCAFFCVFRVVRGPTHNLVVCMLCYI